MSDSSASRSRIVDAARRLIEAGGVEALSMRKVAADVGLAPTAIYWHVGGRDDLLRAVLDAMVAHLPPISARGEDPRARIASVVRAVRRQFLDGIRMLQLANEVGRGNELSFRAQVVLAQELTESGLEGEEAASVLRSLLFLAGGFVVIEQQYRERDPGELATGELWAAQDEPGIDPSLREAMADPVDTDALFEATLGRVLDGVFGSP